MRRVRTETIVVRNALTHLPMVIRVVRMPIGAFNGCALSGRAASLVWAEMVRAATKTETEVA